MDSDEDLVLRAQQGEHTAFDALHARYKASLTRYCARLLRNEHEGEQAAQDAFLLAWQNLPSFRGEGRFEGWLRATATRVCLKLIRTAKGIDRLKGKSLDDADTLADIEGRQFAIGAKDRVGDEAVMRLLAQQIARRILECSRTARPPWDALDLDIFQLHYAQGVESKREVARRLGENEPKVKYRIYYRIDPVIKKVRQEYEAADTAV